MKDKDLRNILEGLPRSYGPWRLRRLELIVEALLEKNNITAVEAPLIDRVVLKEKCSQCGR